MSFPRYPEYKDSGVESIGEVPAHWLTKRLSYLFGQISSGTTPPSEDPENYDGDVFWVTTGELRENYIDGTEKTVTEAALKKFTSLKVYPAGTLLMAMYGATIGRLGILGVAASTNQACCAFALPINANVRFVFHWLLAVRDHLILIASGGGQPNINQDKIRSLKVAVPPLPEQTAIAAFLDRETGKIDALVAEQEKLIALLKEKRQAVISHAVTKGLNPDAPMKPSGIEWLGDVPAHWMLARLKYVSPFITVGIVVNPSDYVSDDGLPFIYGGDISEGSIASDSARRITPEHSEKNSKTRLQAGDLLTVRVGAPGVTAVVGLDCEGGNCASVMLVRRGAFDSRWLCFAMNSRMVRYQVEVVQYGAAQEQFNISHAINFWIAVPPRAEQNEIADGLARKIAAIDSLISEAERAITLLQERRSALISAAVTGQIDVRGLAGASASDSA